MASGPFRGKGDEEHWDATGRSYRFEVCWPCFVSNAVTSGSSGGSSARVKAKTRCGSIGEAELSITFPARCATAMGCFMVDRFNLYSPNIPGIIPGLGITRISPRSPRVPSQGPSDPYRILPEWTVAEVVLAEGQMLVNHIPNVN